MPQYLINNSYLTIDEAIGLVCNNATLSLAEDTKNAIIDNRAYLEHKLKADDRPIYGINTGFGSLCNVIISDEQLAELQHNLIVSHACGAGSEIPVEVSQLILLLKIINLSKACSGVRLELIEHMIKIYNAGIYPVIYELGSLGASGDLAPLAHLSLTLLGLGKSYYQDKKIDSIAALQLSGIEPIKLQAKEGLALINGTQFTLAHALYNTFHAQRLMDHANGIAAVSLEAFGCKLSPFDPSIGKIRNNAAQSSVAAEILTMVGDSTLMKTSTFSVQDPYSFRCIPQVHGASLHAINHVKSTIEAELNAVTDNPNILHLEDKIISAGNFHAQNIALVSDYLAIALSELANISERRLYQLINGDRDLPMFLIKEAGLHSGLMIAQYTAASVVSQNKQLSTPASVDSIVSSKGQEDHVSMGSNASTKCMKIVDNVYTVLAIEYFASCQAIEFRDASVLSNHSQAMRASLRKEVACLVADRLLYNDIEKTKQVLKQKSSLKN